MAARPHAPLVVFSSDNGPQGETAREMGNQATPDMGNSGPFRGELGEATEGSIRTAATIVKNQTKVHCATATRSKIHSAEVRSGVASFGSRLAVYGLEFPSADLGEISLEEEVEQSSNHCDDREAHQLVPARGD